MESAASDYQPSHQDVSVLRYENHLWKYMYISRWSTVPKWSYVAKQWGYHIEMQKSFTHTNTPQLIRRPLSWQGDQGGCRQTRDKERKNWTTPPFSPVPSTLLSSTAKSRQAVVRVHVTHASEKLASSLTNTLHTHRLSFAEPLYICTA